MPTTWETNLENREATIDRDARQAPPFRAGKDSADGEVVQTQPDGLWIELHRQSEAGTRRDDGAWSDPCVVVAGISAL